ncbi:unnamed protein product [Clonostachys rosea]|uniref:Uncharacterized protein n=1 Tax=Bionectria ochroleuca TaxID=29856 RepID=A0ABY6UQ36_BIOOC|nr:unnamed protein product [Clonostachys rosea]
MINAAQLNGLLKPPEKETVEQMFLRLYELVDVVYNAASPVEEGQGKIDLAKRAGDAVVPLVVKLQEQYKEQETRVAEQDDTIRKFRDELIQKDIELKRAYTNMEQDMESDSSQESSKNEGQYPLNSVPLSARMGDRGVHEESVENIANDAFQFGRFESDPGNSNNIITITMPTDDDSEKIQSRRPSLEAEMGPETQPSPTSSEASQSELAPHQYQRTLSEESLPQQAYDMTFPSSRGTFRRPGPVYETIPNSHTKPKSNQKTYSGEDLAAEEGDTTLSSQESNDAIGKPGNSGGGTKADKSLPEVLKQRSHPKSATPKTGNDSPYTFSAYIQGLQSPEPHPPWSRPKFLQQRKYGKSIIFHGLEWLLYTSMRLGWDLVSGQLIAWWHLLLFLITAVCRVTMALHLFTSGTGILESFHLPKLPVFIVPRLSWCIIATQVMFFTCLMSFLAWRRELDILLQANGLSRRYMLDYIYEESRMFLFIGIDKGVFRLGTSEPEKFWSDGNDTLKERMIGLTQ